MKGNARVSQTAYATAQFWAAAGFHNAELFASRRGAVGHWLLKRGQQLAGPALPPAARYFDQFVMARHRAIDGLLDEYQPTVVIEIAAGLSPRGLSWAQRFPDGHYIEVDLPAMAAEKQRRLNEGRVTMPANLSVLAADALADDFAEQVLALPAMANPPARLMIISEGLLDYLDHDQKIQLWRGVAKLMAAAKESRYLFECWPLAGLRQAMAFRAGIAGLELLTGQRMHHRLLENAAAVEQLAARAGLAVSRVPPSDYASAFGSLPAAKSPWQLFSAG